MSKREKKNLTIIFESCGSNQLGVQNKIVASAGNLGRVGGKFGRIGEKFWTRRREVLDGSAGIFGRVESEFCRIGERTVPVPKWYLCDATNNYKFGRVVVISRQTLRR